MGLCTFGVSGGVVVTNQLGGVTLTQAGDYAAIQISNASPPAGPDTSGIFALSPGLVAGAYTNATVTVQFVADPVNFAANNWQLLNNVIRNDANTYVNGSLLLVNSSALQLNPGQIGGLYAIRVYLNSITSGSVLVTGNTNPGGLVGVDQAILAQLVASNAINKGLLLAQYDATGTDYLSAVGGSW